MHSGMRIIWSLPVPGEPLGSGRGDLVRARSLIGALRSRGHEVVVVAAADRVTTATAVRSYREGVRRLLPQWGALGLRTLGRLALARAHARRVATEARTQRADLIVETQMHGVPSGARAAREAGMPLVLDDCSPPEEEVTLRTVLPGLVHRTFRQEAVAAAALTVSSKALARRLEFNGVPKEKMAVVPNGVTLEDFSVGDREATRQRMGLEGRFVVGFVGSFQPWHRVDLLLEAVAVQCTPTPIHLLLVGEGVGREAIEVHAVHLGIAERITTTGSLPSSEIPTVLAACDIGVLPGSNDYGQPMKLAEYAAAGLPAVAPNLAPVRESLQNGHTGLLFPPGDAQALSEIIACLARDAPLRTRLGKAARESVRERTWANSATRMEKALAAVSFPGEAP